MLLGLRCYRGYLEAITKMEKLFEVKDGAGSEEPRPQVGASSYEKPQQTWCSHPNPSMFGVKPIDYSYHETTPVGSSGPTGHAPVRSSGPTPVEPLRRRASPLCFDRRKDENRKHKGALRLK